LHRFLTSNNKTLFCYCYLNTTKKSSSATKKTIQKQAWGKRFFEVQIF
jgi:hypothetical protein